MAQRYLRLGDDVPVSVLSDYLQGVVRRLKPPSRLILPFDFNQSQSRAITAALNHNISVIEGPPGTGKTQTILNLIANIVYAGKNCAVISNNNTAVENVYEKLEEEKLAFLAAGLGRKSNVEVFFEKNQQILLSAFLKENRTSLTEKELNRMDELSQTIGTIQDLEVKTAELESKLIELQHEKRYYNLISEIPSNPKVLLSSSAYLNLLLRLQEARNLRFYERWLITFRLKINTRKTDINALIQLVEQLYYISRTRELIHQIETNLKFLKNQHKEQISRELHVLYRKALEQNLFERYSKLPVKTFTASDYKNDFRGFLQRFPVVLSTSWIFRSILTPNSGDTDPPGSPGI